MVSTFQTAVRNGVDRFRPGKHYHEPPVAGRLRVTTRYFSPGSTPQPETRILTAWMVTHTTICHREFPPRFEPRLRHEDAAGHSALTLRKVRAVLELRHGEVELSFEQRPRGCGPSSTCYSPRFEPAIATRGRRRPGVCATIATGVWVRQTNPVC